MFGPLGQRTAGATRRSRRKVALGAALLLLAALVVGEVVNQIAQSNSPVARRAARSWVAAVGPIVTSSNDLGRALADLRAAAPGATRSVLDAQLAALVAGTTSELDTLAQLDLPVPRGAAGPLLTDVLAARRRGVAALVAGVALATGPGRSAQVPAATDRLVAAGRQFRLADDSYVAFRHALPADALGGGLPASRWLASPGEWSPAAAGAFASRLASARQLAERHALALVAVSLEPPPVHVSGLAIPVPTTTTLPPKRVTVPSSTTTTLPPRATTSGSTTTTSSTTTTTTLPPTTTTLQIPPPSSVSEVAATTRIRVVVVLANAGTVAATGVALEARLEPRGGTSARGALARARIGTLATGSARYVVLPAMPVVAGARYALVVRASGDAVAPVSHTLALRVTN